MRGVQKRRYRRANGSPALSTSNARSAFAAVQLLRTIQTPASLYMKGYVELARAGRVRRRYMLIAPRNLKVNIEHEVENAHH